MSILDYTKNYIINRGYNYYKNDKIISYQQTSYEEYTAQIKGSGNNIYLTKINVNHPFKCTCTCPYATGRTICKHMIALQFAADQALLDNYEEEKTYHDEKTNYYYEEGYDEYEEYDYYEDYYSSEPLFFKDALKEYLHSVDRDFLEKIAFENLKKNPKDTYRLYLEKNYTKLVNVPSSYIDYLESLKERINDLLRIDYFMNDFSEKIISSDDYSILEKLYQNQRFKNIIDQLLLNEDLAIYSSFNQIINFYKTYNPNSINHLYTKLEEKLIDLKHSYIKEELPKSNVLINMYKIKAPAYKDLAVLLLKNGNYNTFIKFIMQSNLDYNQLFNSVVDELKLNYRKYKYTLCDIIWCFNDYIDKEKVIYYYGYFGFLSYKTKDYLEFIASKKNKEEIFELFKNEKNKILLMNLYQYCDKQELLFNLLKDNINDLKSNAEYLDKYNEKLKELFKQEFYNILAYGKKVEYYVAACQYISAITKLTNGIEYAQKIRRELENSTYSKCKSLFKEFDQCLKG